MWSMKVSRGVVEFSNCTLILMEQSKREGWGFLFKPIFDISNNRYQMYVRILKIPPVFDESKVFSKMWSLVNLCSILRSQSYFKWRYGLWFQSKKLVLNLDTTNLTVDPALAVVGGLSENADETQPTRPKRKLRQCTYCVRSFTEEEKLAQNINMEHYME